MCHSAQSSDMDCGMQLILCRAIIEKMLFKTTVEEYVCIFVEDENENV